MKLLPHSLPRFLARGFLACGAVCSLFVATQDFQLFPLLVASFGAVTSVPPREVEELRIPTPSGDTALAWRIKATTLPPARQRAALLFHGNGETLRSFLPMQRWFAARGINSYAVEYPGYGGHAGWPSENKIYAHGQAVFDFLLKQESLGPEETLVFGNSIGTGPAAHIAAKNGAGTLVLLSPYTSITALVEEMPLIGYLTPFLWWRFPNSEYISSLSSTCVVTAHGRRDGTIPYHHSERLQGAYKGRARFSLITIDQAGHNDLFARAAPQVDEALAACAERIENAP